MFKESVIITLGGRRMSLSHWYEGSESDQVRGVNLDVWLIGHRKIPAVQWAKLPRYWREGAVEVRPFPAKTRLCVSEAQGLSGEAVKGNPPTTVIPGVDENKSSPRTNRRLDRTSVDIPALTVCVSEAVKLSRLRWAASHDRGRCG